jgi:hypothetical protein
MILYVNGEDYSAGAKTATNFSFANDDFRFVALGSKPHPDNLAVCYGMHLSKLLKLALICGAEASSTNRRILDTTYEYINNIDPKQHTVVIIGWAKVEKKTVQEHEEIYELHQYLDNKKVTHLFFNAVDPFTNVPENLHKDWGNNFIDPYAKIANEYDHLFWAQYLFKHLTTHKFNV